MLLNRSSTARYDHPSWVGMYVMSAHHDSFGPDGSKSRARTFGATGSRWLESVVRTNRRGTRASIPWALTSLATVFSEHSCPRAFSSAAIRGLPYRRFTSAWTSLIAPTNSCRHYSVGLSGREAQA
jgi:hypothetical protein